MLDWKGLWHRQPTRKAGNSTLFPSYLEDIKRIQAFLWLCMKHAVSRGTGTGAATQLGNRTSKPEVGCAFW